MRVLTLMLTLAAGSAWLLLTAASPAQDKKEGPKGGKVIVIKITKEREYIEEGAKAQKPVIVKVGQTVRWQNEDSVKHTATSDLESKPDEPLFDTEDIAAKGKKKDRVEITFDKEKWDAAAKALKMPNAKELRLTYYCGHHEGQKGEIILKLK